MKGGQGISCFRPRNEGGRQTLRGTWDSAVPGNRGNQMPSPGTFVSLGFFFLSLPVATGSPCVCGWGGGPVNPHPTSMRETLRVFKNDSQGQRGHRINLTCEVFQVVVEGVSEGECGWTL